MENRQITGMGFDFKDGLVTIKLYDCKEPKDESADEPTPFTEFKVHQDSYSIMVQALIQIGVEIQNDFNVNLGLPELEFNEEGE